MFFRWSNPEQEETAQAIVAMGYPRDKVSYFQKYEISPDNLCFIF